MEYNLNIIRKSLKISAMVAVLLIVPNILAAVAFFNFSGAWSVLAWFVLVWNLLSVIAISTHLFVVLAVLFPKIDVLDSLFSICGIGEGALRGRSIKIPGNKDEISVAIIFPFTGNKNEIEEVIVRLRRMETAKASTREKIQKKLNDLDREVNLRLGGGIDSDNPEGEKQG